MLENSLRGDAENLTDITLSYSRLKATTFTVLEQRTVNERKAIIKRQEIC